jgi:hypothetical protein
MYNDEAEGISHLSAKAWPSGSFAALRHLYLHTCRIEAGAVRHLNQLTSIELVAICIVDGSFTMDMDLPDVETVALINAIPITHVRRVLQRRSKLVNLHLEYVYTPLLANALMAWPGLKALCLHHLLLNDWQLRNLPETLPLLEELWLSDNAHITEEGVQSLTTLKALRHLAIDGCDITAHDVAWLLPQFLQLTTLRLTEPPNDLLMKACLTETAEGKGCALEFVSFLPAGDLREFRQLQLFTRHASFNFKNKHLMF